LKPNTIKAVILAGGKGTRIAEETAVRPKPMVEIGGRPILWHIMKSYSHYGVNDFVICCGYLGHKIKEYFLNYSYQNADLTVDLETGAVTIHQSNVEPWRVTLVDTGQDTLTGGRVGRIASYVRNDPFFCMTYGDGVSDVDIGALIAFHERHGKKATVTAVTPLARFGALDMVGDAVTHFVEKPHNEAGYINGGYFVLKPSVLDLIEGDETIFEKGPLETLAADGDLMAFRHDGFWQPMDTLRDKDHLEEMWAAGAPWKSW
jgi:glucose-1-phosphate cytidylyltransferase